MIRPQAFNVTGVSEYTASSNIVRNRIFYSDTRSIEKDGSSRLIPRHDIFHVYKVFLFDIWKQFYIMLESIGFFSHSVSCFCLRHVCFYQRSIFCVIFSTFCTMLSCANYQVVTSLLAVDATTAE